MKAGTRKALTLATAVMFISSCSSAPRDDEAAAKKLPATIARPAGVELPVPGRVGIYISPDELAKKIMFRYSYTGYWFDEGRAIQRAALSVFGKTFDKVAALEEIANPEMVIRVKGKTLQNPIIGTYYADVTADFYRFSGEYLGQLAGDAAVDGAIDSPTALDRAHIAAFEAVAKKVLQDDKILAAARGGK
jgi:hypothetical protein